MASDSDLVARVLSGDREAYTDLVARYQNLVIALVGSHVRDRSALEDLVQDVLVEAYSSLRNLKEKVQRDLVY